ILRGSDFSGAILSDADLSSAELNGAILSRADFNGAILRGSHFDGANLNGADLCGANLTDATLTFANLGDALVSDATLSRATCFGTRFANVDLSVVRDLDSIRHLGPSTVGVDTLLRSRGKIPQAFLQNCGVPESLIKYLPSLIGSMQPIQYHSCFISYSSEDE